MPKQLEILIQTKHMNCQDDKTFSETFKNQRVSKNEIGTMPIEQPHDQEKDPLTQLPTLPLTSLTKVLRVCYTIAETTRR